MSWPPAPPPPSLPPPGWYPDPSGQAAQRWWDGARWTEHVGTPPPLSGVVGPVVATGRGDAELAGWWRRFVGYVLDAIIVSVPGFLIGLLIGYADVSGSAPLATGQQLLSTGAEVAVVAVGVGLAVGYPFVLLRCWGQTLGMMALGVRAVDRVSGSALTTAQTWRRVLAFFVLVTLWDQVAIVIGFGHVSGPQPAGETVFRLVGLAGLATTALWPLGNQLRQTLQDKAAGTVVVRTRR